MHTATLVHATNDGEKLIAYMARVSNPANQDNPSYTKLIKYLIDHKHWSPFEMVNMCVEIHTTRSVAAQLLRHRSFSFQEFSQRYSAVLDSPVIPELREQDTKNRQNSTLSLPPELVSELQSKIDDLFAHAQDTYSLLLASGVAKECARDVLPLSSPTKLYMNGTLRSWLHYCDLRCGNGTQKEHKLIADQVKVLVAQHFPAVHQAMWS
jgi:thymidylate synthase (FAD)